MKKLLKLIPILLAIILAFTGCDISSYLPEGLFPPDNDESIISLDAIPEFDGETP